MDKENRFQDYAEKLNIDSSLTNSSATDAVWLKGYTVSCDCGCCIQLKKIKRNNPLRQRMYCLVLRQLNQMQKGIQSAHSVVEYIKKFGDSEGIRQWMDNDKTLILLDGGTCPEMEETMVLLKENNVDYSVFNEPDLKDLVTCISVLASELVWDRETYPDYRGAIASWDDESFKSNYMKKNEETLKGYGLSESEIFLRGFLGGLKLAN